MNQRTAEMFHRASPPEPKANHQHRHSWPCELHGRRGPSGCPARPGFVSDVDLNIYIYRERAFYNAIVCIAFRSMLHKCYTVCVCNIIDICLQIILQM